LPTTLVSKKLAGVDTPDTAAVTVYGPPSTLLAVKVPALVAKPLALVAAVLAPLNEAVAPLVVPMVKVTVALFTGFPPESFTIATRGTNAVPSATLWGEPLLTAIEAAGPEVFVSVNEAGVATPVAVAVTV